MLTLLRGSFLVGWWIMGWASVKAALVWRTSEVTYGRVSVWHVRPGLRRVSRVIVAY